MNSEGIRHILGSHKLSRTPIRKAILELMMEASTALSEKEIQEKLACSCDRSTVYRSLRTFLDKGIIHEVTIDSIVRFALPNGKIKNEAHAHFKCEVCDAVICLEHITMETIRLPKGYMPRNHNVLITGVCRDCNKQEKGE
ncbi:MAG: Fur family transcriptional regulator [Bacteroidota bacterium]